MFELTPEKARVLETSGNILILGGPGSGKTTIALRKADHDIRLGALRVHQKILFLSFARATVSRVKQLAEGMISAEGSQLTEVNTYHGFAWALLRSHGYLLNGHKAIRLLSPPDAAARLADISGAPERLIEMRRIFQEEGTLHFDVFAEFTAELLTRSTALAGVISNAYPIIVLDEFQDTNPSEWQMIQALGCRSSLIALADPDQRIYDFRGADPKRIAEFIQVYNPVAFDFGAENNRSDGTDIVTFGNDLLNGVNVGGTYRDVSCVEYRALKGAGLHLDLKIQVFNATVRLQKAEVRDWSLAVLVPTNQLMMEVSEYLNQEQTLKNGGRLVPIPHDVAFDNSGPALAAGLIAGILEGDTDSARIAGRMLLALRDHIRGRKGNEAPGQQQLGLAGALDTYLSTGVVKGPARKALVNECQRIAEQIAALSFSGDPGEDWLTVRRLLHESQDETIRRAAHDATYLRLLRRGSALRSSLGELWRNSGSYRGASLAVANALMQEHFSNATKDWRGIHVMTIHKSKGKEFDEVIVYEGLYQHRFVYPSALDHKVLEARRNLRVAVTRAKLHATLMTPTRDRCRFL